MGSSYNSFGQIGLIQTPTADSKQEGSLSLTLNKNDIWKFGTLSVSPFNWLEASYFYYRPSDLRWEGNNVAGHYLDKGFNVKFKYKPKNNNRPNLAIGLDDFAGTGFFSREYIVVTQDLRDIKVTAGLGWGKFTGENSFDNPLSFLSNKLDLRPSISSNYDRGGTPSYDKWFRGDAALFGGLEYFVPNQNGLSIKLEYDPFNYLDFSAQNRSDASFDLRKKDSNINIGLSYPLNKFLTIDASFIKGNTFNLSFTIGTTFNDQLSKKKKFNPSLDIKKNKEHSKIEFYESILLNLNNNNLFLQTASLKENDLDVSISTSQHRNAIRSSSYAASIVQKVAEKHEMDINQINISHINAGIELNNIKYIANHINNDNLPIELLVRNTALESGDPIGFKKDEFKPNIDFPVVFSSISPTLVTHIGNPEKFFFGGVNLQHISEIQFSRNLLLSTEFNARVYGDFDNTISGPGSVMEHVRTDLVEYLKEDDIVISRMQLDYVWSPRKDTYAKLSGGIYETMFAGYGIETLYKPFGTNYSLGFEIFHVKQRSFDQRFSFKDYNTVTGHFNFGYSLPFGIESNISYGRYLAKDDGFTFDLGRRTRSGFKVGIYFTRTNVSAETFGEGSFDKGFYFQIPMDLFSTGYSGNYSTFKLSPLTRDGGAKLIHDKDLKGLIYNSTYRELSQQWRGLLN
ncbi:YjbH domain-containing protein [Gammaproteobacteria bacterium]|nr:YjbH domain-containing protein [Gammaproteobacteria bacterium]